MQCAMRPISKFKINRHFISRSLNPCYIAHFYCGNGYNRQADNVTHKINKVASLTYNTSASDVC